MPNVTTTINADIPALIGASAAAVLTGAPFNGPVGAARVGYIDGNYVLNPSSDQLLDSALNLVVAGTSTSVLMVESEAKQLSEEVMLGAVMFGHEQFQIAIDSIQTFQKDRIYIISLKEESLQIIYQITFKVQT